jgi:hypothetical protein
MGSILGGNKGSFHSHEDQTTVNISMLLPSSYAVTGGFVITSINHAVDGNYERSVRTGLVSGFIFLTGIWHSESLKLQIRVQTLGKTAVSECPPFVVRGKENGHKHGSQAPSKFTVIAVHPMKAYWGRGIAPPILNFGTRWR